MLATAPINPFNPWFFCLFICSDSHFRSLERSVPHTARSSQCGQRRRQCSYRYANHHFPKTFLLHSFYLLILNSQFLIRKVASLKIIEKLNQKIIKK